MPSYRNGQVPPDLLVAFNSGYNKQDGNWTHSLPPATYARHLALVALALLHTGRLLRLGVGWTAYRPLFAQVFLKRIMGILAATPGTSSHGLFWEGRQCAAMDYGNWAWVYEHHGGRAAFARDCRAVGLLPNQIVPARGYPDEPWHVIDPDPWGAVPVFAGVVLPFNPEPIKEVDDMFNNEDRDLLRRAATASESAKAGVWNGGADIIDGVAQRFAYGVLPISAHTQQLVAQQAGRLAAIEQVVEQLAAGNGAILDFPAIELAAERGAREALNGIVLRAESI